MSALAETRALFDLRADILLPVDLEDGTGFAARCPVDRSTVIVRPNEGDFNVVFECESGCEHSRIADKLDELTASADGFATRDQDDQDNKVDADATVAESWQPVALLTYLAADREPESPLLLARSDGPALLYAGRLHAVSAEPEAGKGWLALTACVEAITEHERPVVYIDYEDTPESIANRLLALGVNFEAIRDHFHYLRPDEPVTVAAVDRLAELQPALVVIDGVTEALAIEGLDMANNQDVAEFYKRLARPFARAAAAVLLVDHVVKDKEARGRYAIGAQHKLAGVDVAYRLDVAQPFGRGREGLVKVTVMKDRPGYVRQHAADNERVAMMRLASDEGRVTVTLEAPDTLGATWRPTRYMERVSRTLEGCAEGLTRRAIRDTVTGKNEHILHALDVLITEGFVTENTEGRYPTHSSQRSFRADDDNQRSPGPAVVPDRSPDPLNGSGPPVPPFKGPGTTANTDSPGASNGVVPFATSEQEALIARLETAA